MKTLILTAIRCSLMFLVPSITYAISAQWDLDSRWGRLLPADEGSNAGLLQKVAKMKKPPSPTYRAHKKNH